MALIKCPECGKEVSSTAKYCVHCGYSFIVCPDCNAVLDGNTKVCPECGCVLKKDEPQTILQKQSVQEDDEAVNTSVLWNNRFAATAKKAKTARWVKVAADVISAIFLLVAVFTMIGWSDKSEAERFMSLSNTRNTVKTMTALSIVFTVISIVLEIFDETVLTLLCRNTIIREKWDLKSYMNEHGDDMYVEASFDKSLKVCLAATYWNECPQAVVYEFIEKAVQAVIWTVFGILIGVFCMQAIDYMLKMVLVGAKFNFKDLKYGALIGAAVCFGVAIVCGLTYEFTIGSKYDKWKEEYTKSEANENA